MTEGLKLSSGWVDPTSAHSTPQPVTGKGDAAWLLEPGVLAGVYVHQSVMITLWSPDGPARDRHDDARRKERPKLRGTTNSCPCVQTSDCTGISWVLVITPVFSPRSVAGRSQACLGWRSVTDRPSLRPLHPPVHHGGGGSHRPPPGRSERTVRRTGETTLIWIVMAIVLIVIVAGGFVGRARRGRSRADAARRQNHHQNHH